MPESAPRRDAGHLTFLNPLGLLALLAIPVILGFHFFRQQKRSRQVGGLHLWDFARIATPAGRRFERLIATLPLLFQLLAAVLLALLLAGLDWPVDQAARHFSIILDDSVSMQARVSGTTSAQRAADALEEWTEDADRFTLVAAGNRPVVLAGPAAAKPDLMRALNDWTPDAPLANADDAVNIATKFGSQDSRLLLLTDNPTQAEHLKDSATVWGVGRAAVNNAIIFADRFRASKDADRIVAKVEGFGGSPRSVTLTAYRGEQALTSRQLDLETSKPVSVEFDLPDTQSPIRLSITPPDALAADDNVILVPAEQKPVRVYMPEGLPHRESFLRAVTAVRDTLLAPTPADADLAFVMDGEAALNVRRVYVFSNTQTTDGLRMAAGRDLVTAGESRLTQNLGLDGVIWPFDRSAPGDASQALRADISYTSIPLLYAERTTSASARYRVNLALDATNIFRHTAWPVLVLNMIEECRGALPGLGRTNLRAGEELVLNLEPAAEGADVFTLWREGEPQPLQTWQEEPPSVLTDLTPGTYFIRQGDTIESPEMARFRVNLFNQGESDLQSLKELKPDLKSLAAGRLEQTDRNYLIYYALLVGLVGCIVLGWVYHDAGH